VIVRGASAGSEPASPGVVGASVAPREVKLRERAPSPPRPDIRFSGPTLAPVEKPVRIEALAELVGSPAFLRIQRCDGRSEVVAATIESVGRNAISLSSFAPAKARELLRPSDTFWIASPGREALTLAPGDTITTAVGLPFDAHGLPPGATRRVELRSRAQAFLDGHPREGISDIEPHLRRDPTGGVYRTNDKRPVIDAAASEELKTEQNAIVMVFAAKLTALYKERTSCLSAFGEVVDSHQPLRALEEVLVGVATSVMNAFERDLTDAPDGPLGRAWKRLGVVHSLMQAYVPQIVVSSSPRRLLEQGLRTPLEVLARLTEVAQHHTAGSDVRPSDVVRASAPFILKLSLSHLKILETVEHMLVDGRHDESWNPDFFSLEGGRLELTAAFMQKLASERGVRFDGLLAKTSGCPAAQTFAGANPVRDFIDLFADFVGKLEVAQAER
jgi:hypothetical protein